MIRIDRTPNPYWRVARPERDPIEELNRKMADKIMNPPLVFRGLQGLAKLCYLTDDLVQARASGANWRKIKRIERKIKESQPRPIDYRALLVSV